MFQEESGLDIQQRSQENQDSWHGNFGEKELLTVIWLQWQHTFAHVQKALCDSNTEEWIWLFVVVTGQFSENLGQSGVVGACPYQSQTDDRSQRNLAVSVVSQFEKHVHRADLRVRNAQHRKGQRHYSFLLNLAVIHDVVQQSCSHLISDLLARSD